MKTPPGQMSGPAWKAVPSVEAVDAQDRGGGGGGGGWSHPGIVSSGWGLNTMRLLWNISKGWTLHHSCSRRQIRRCLGTLSWRVVFSSLGSARAIFGRGTGLNPGPESMSTAGPNHGGKLGCAAGERWTCGREPKWGGAAGASCGCEAAGEVEGCAAGEKRRAYG